MDESAWPVDTKIGSRSWDGSDLKEATACRPDKNTEIKARSHQSLITKQLKTGPIRALCVLMFHRVDRGCWVFCPTSTPINHAAFMHCDWSDEPFISAVEDRSDLINPWCFEDIVLYHVLSGTTTLPYQQTMHCHLPSCRCSLPSLLGSRTTLIAHISADALGGHRVEYGRSHLPL